MQQQPVIHVIGVGEVGIRIINQLIRYEPDYIAIGIALATDEETLYDAQIPIRVLASGTSIPPEITSHLHGSNIIFFIVDYRIADDMLLAQQAVVAIHHLGIPTIALVTKIEKRRSLFDTMRGFMRRTVEQDAAFMQLQQVATGVFELDHLQTNQISSFAHMHAPPPAITYARAITSSLLKILRDPGLITLDVADFTALFRESAKVGLVKTYIGSGIDINQQIVTALQHSRILIEKHTRFILNIYCSESFTLLDISTIASEIENICGPNGSITWGLLVDVNYPEDYLQIDLFAV